MLNNLLGGILGKVVDNAEGILDKVITTDKERDAAKFEIKNQRPSHIKPQFKKFWDEYNEQKICKGSFLVSPYANILEDKYMMPLVEEKFNFNRDVVEKIRNSHPRYLKF